MDRGGAGAGELVILVLGRGGGFSDVTRGAGLVVDATAAHARVPLAGSVVKERAGDTGVLVLVCNFPREGEASGRVFDSNGTGMRVSIRRISSTLR